MTRACPMPGCKSEREPGHIFCAHCGRGFGASPEARRAHVAAKRARDEDGLIHAADVLRSAQADYAVRVELERRHGA